MQESFILFKFLKFTMIRGAESSADEEKLRFNITANAVSSNTLDFTLEFYNPELVGIGSKPDFLEMKVINSDFFGSLKSGFNIPQGYSVRFILPKMLNRSM